MLDRAAALEDRRPDALAVLRLVDQQPLEMRIADRDRARQRLVGVDIGRDRLDAGRGAAADDRDATRSARSPSCTRSAPSRPCRPRRGRGRARWRASATPRSTWAWICLKILMFHDLGHRAFERDGARLEEGVEAHHAEADAALALGADSWRAPSRRARGRYSRCSTLSRKRITSSMNILSPFHSSQVSRLRTERQQTAVRCGAEMVGAGRQRDLRAQVRGGDLEAEVAVMLGHRPVHLVDEDDVGLAGREPGLDQLLEQRAGVDAWRAPSRPWGSAASIRRRRAPPP